MSPKQSMPVQDATGRVATASNFLQTRDIPRKKVTFSTERVSPQIKQSIVQSFFSHGIGVIGTARRIGIKTVVVERVIREESRTA